MSTPNLKGHKMVPPHLQSENEKGVGPSSFSYLPPIRSPASLAELCSSLQYILQSFVLFILND